MAGNDTDWHVGAKFSCSLKMWLLLVWCWALRSMFFVKQTWVFLDLFPWFIVCWKKLSNLLHNNSTVHSKSANMPEGHWYYHCTVQYICITVVIIYPMAVQVYSKALRVTIKLGHLFCSPSYYCSLLMLSKLGSLGKTWLISQRGPISQWLQFSCFLPHYKFQGVFNIYTHPTWFTVQQL